MRNLRHSLSHKPLCSFPKARNRSRALRARKAVLRFPDLQPLAHGAQLLAHGAHQLAHGTQPLAHGAQPLAHGAQPLAYGIQLLAHGIQLLVHSVQLLAHGAMLFLPQDSADFSSSSAKPIR